MSSLSGEQPNSAQATNGQTAAEAAARESGAATGSAGEGGSGDDRSGAAQSEGGGGRIRRWFASLGRSLIILVVTLVVLAFAGGVTDVVLHTTRHTSAHTTEFGGVSAVDVVLDGDIALDVVGQDQAQDQSTDATAATLTEVNTSTPFDDPVQTVDVIGATLYLTERCPDARCSVQLTLDVDASTRVSVVAGNALRLSDAVVQFTDLAAPATVIADPAKVVVTNTVTTGAVIGSLQCDSDADCRGVATPTGGG